MLRWISAVGFALAVGACGGRQDIGATAPTEIPAVWDEAFMSVSEGHAPEAEAGEWVISRGTDGDIRAHHRTKRVAGGALGEIDDSVLEARVYAAIASSSELQSKDIGASAEDGVIMLTGRVDSARTASHAVRTALSTTGVGEVRSRLIWQ